eukprot:PhF_6_TR21204/c1_g1_i1/m.30608
MQLQNIPNDFDSHSIILNKWQQRLGELNTKTSQNDVQLNDARNALVDKETAVRTVLSDFTRIVQAPTPSGNMKGGGGREGTSEGGKKKPGAGGKNTPDLDSMNPKQRAAIVAAMTELFNGTILKDETVDPSAPEGGPGRPNSKPKPKESAAAAAQQQQQNT